MIGVPEKYQDAGTVTKANLKAAAGRVLAIRVTNANAAVRWFGIHNKATAPAGTDVPDMFFLVPAGTATVPGVLVVSSEVLGEAGRPLGTGVGWAVGTTAASFTDSATAAEHTTTVMYS